MLARGGTAVAIGVPAPDSTVTIAWGETNIGAAYPNKATLKITDGGDPVAEDFMAWLEASAEGRLDLRPLVSVIAHGIGSDRNNERTAMLRRQA